MTIRNDTYDLLISKLIRVYKKVAKEEVDSFR
jgi:hypothetical protein